MMDPRDIFSYDVTQPFSAAPLGHTGVDLALPLGTPVEAEGAGEVESVFADRVGGNQVKLKYASGAEGWFAHLAAIFVQPGQHVAATDVIGASGASGKVTGPHLHFEERDPSGKLIDPMTAEAHAFLGGARADPVAATEKTCKPGSKLINGICFTAGGFGPQEDFISNPAGPAVRRDPPLVDVPAKIGELLNGTQRAIAGLAIGGAVVAVVVLVGFSGAKRALD